MLSHVIHRSVLDAEIARYEERTRASRGCHARALAIMPGGDTRTATFFEPYPTFMARGQGQWLYDVDGHPYRDVLCNFTSLIHGHAHPDVTRALNEQNTLGTAFGAPGTAASDLAEAIKARCPSVEHLRFCNSGTEANLYAVRAARAFTNRRKILKVEGGYHGGYDPFRVSVSPVAGAAGLPQPRPEEPGLSPAVADEVIVVPFNDLEVAQALLDEHAHDLAAVIVEPLMSVGGMIPAEPGYLRGLRSSTRDTGVLLIFDEVVTLRLAVGGAQSLYGVTPDLTTFGKLIGGGLPIGAFGGRADVMACFDPRGARRISQSGTFNGNVSAMVAGVVTLSLLTASEISRINALGERLRMGATEILRAWHVAGRATGLGSLMQLHFVEGPIRNTNDTVGTPKWASRVLHLGLMNRGVFSASRGMFTLSTAMTEPDVNAVLQALDEVVQQIAAVNGGS